MSTNNTRRISNQFFSQPQGLTWTAELLHVFLQEFPMEVISDGVIDEALGSLGFAASLVLEDHIVIPPEASRMLREWNT